MFKIELQNKTKAISGKIETYWFENEFIGLENTLFHRIIISLIPFNSGLEYVEQPEITEIVFEWYNLRLKDENNIDGLNLNSKNYPEAEASIYLGSAHNICHIEKLKFKKIREHIFEIDGKILIDFEREGVASNENFTFNVISTFFH